jgi:hypothetical protein
MLKDFIFTKFYPLKRAGNWNSLGAHPLIGIHLHSSFYNAQKIIGKTIYLRPDCGTRLAAWGLRLNAG